MQSRGHNAKSPVSTRLRARDLVALAAFLAIVASAAWLGAMFKPGAWYSGLVKPVWTPPNAVFAPVWSVLYLLIALAGWTVWRTGERGPTERRLALLAWGAGFTLNAAWSWLFFGQHWVGFALIDIVALWCTIVTFIVTARRVSPLASWLFVPYGLWVGFAAALNFEIWRLNG